MRLVLGTICLNSMQWLDRLYHQHKGWPGLVKWVFVEGCDPAYRAANPKLVSEDGLSVDGTGGYLEALAGADDRVEYVRYGMAGHADPAQGKCQLRSAYLEAADRLKPDWVVSIDDDEFYPLPVQPTVNRHLNVVGSGVTSVCFRQREIWRPACLKHLPLFGCEVVGGLWKMTHCKCWRWRRGMRHLTSHSHPETGGQLLSKAMVRYDNVVGTPEWIHLGWASDPELRAAKTLYYQARGEGLADGRGRWMACRRAAASWKPNEPLPCGASVVRYTGPVPEVFIKRTQL